MYPDKFIFVQIRPSAWRFYLRADKFICVQINLFFVSTWNTFVLTWNTFGRGILPHRSTSAAAHSPVLSLRQPGKMSSPPSEDPLASFDFLSECLPAIDFGEGFRFDEPFNIDDSGDGISVIATGGSLSYGTYDD